MSIIRSLNVDEFSQRRTQIKYPNLLIKNINPITPLVVPVLEKGDMPVIGVHEGVRKIIGYISISAFNVDKLLRTHGALVYSNSESEVIEINKIEDYLEVFSWTY